jgi:hypothetical protein
MIYNDITNNISSIEGHLIPVFFVAHGVFYWYPPVGISMIPHDLVPHDLLRNVLIYSYGPSHSSLKSTEISPFIECIRNNQL